jgi:5'-nucleotidase
LDAAAQKVRQMVLHLQSQAMIAQQPWLLNVNIPNAAFEHILPVKLCRLGRRHAAEKVITQVSPRGETMYWIGSAGEAMDDGEGTDFHAARQGHMTVTPLKVDLTDHDSLGAWGQSFANSVQSPHAMGKS